MLLCLRAGFVCTSSINVGSEPTNKKCFHHIHIIIPLSGPAAAPLPLQSPKSPSSSVLRRRTPTETKVETRLRAHKKMLSVVVNATAVLKRLLHGPYQSTAVLGIQKPFEREQREDNIFEAKYKISKDKKQKLTHKLAQKKASRWRR